jgi:hypothetical protein
LKKLRQSRVFFFYCQAQQAGPVQERSPSLKHEDDFLSCRKKAHEMTRGLSGEPGSTVKRI